MRSRKNPIIRLFPTLRFPVSIFEGEETDFLQHFNANPAITVSEDDKFVYIECAVPGVDWEEIELTFEDSFLWIKAERKEAIEDKKKIFHYRADSSFTYRVDMNPDVDYSAVPNAIFKQGMLKIIFPKIKKRKLKKIPITDE